MRRTLAFGAASVAVLFVLGAAVPLACFYPDYSFDEPPDGQGGAGASTSSSSSSGSGGGPSSGGNGGAPVGGGGAASSSSVGGNLGEICANGIDDDDDRWVDCEDTECTDYACVPVVPPSGWTGYFAVYDGPIADPGCTDEYPGTTTEFVGNKNLMAPAADCSACICSGPTGQTCVGPTTLTVDDATCALNETCFGELAIGPANGTCGIPDGFILPVQSFCGPAGNCTMGGGGTSPCNASASIQPPTLMGGSCNASGGVADVTEATWGNLGRACGDVTIMGAGCNVNQACLPRPDSPFESGICIRQDGDVACPAGAFTDKHVFFTGLTDNRACSACGCAAPAGGSCEVTVEAHSNNGCTAPVATLVASTAPACANITGNPEVRGRKSTVTKPPSGSSCNTMGGQPTGNATPTGAVTFCCTN